MIDRHAVHGLLKAGQSTKQIAAQYGVTRRTIQRTAKEPPVDDADDGAARRLRGIGRPAVAEQVRVRLRDLITADREAPPLEHLRRLREPAHVEGPDRVWVSDITYVPTREGWLYLAIVLDLATRVIVGWSMSESIDRSLVLNALRMALDSRRPGPGLLHHSDRGVQYACEDHRALLAAHGIVASMSRKGNCWDNAVAESFFATLERELIDDADWATREEARRDIFEFIEIWYNRQRRHSTLGYLTPASYEEQLLLKKAA